VRNQPTVQAPPEGEAASHVRAIASNVPSTNADTPGQRADPTASTQRVAQNDQTHAHECFRATSGGTRSGPETDADARMQTPAYGQSRSYHGKSSDHVTSHRGEGRGPRAASGSTRESASRTRPFPSAPPCLLGPPRAVSGMAACRWPETGLATLRAQVPVARPPAPFSVISRPPRPRPPRRRRRRRRRRLPHRPVDPTAPSRCTASCGTARPL